MADIELTNAQRLKIKRAVASLNDVRREIQQDNPEHYINWYLEDNDNFNLMEGDSHDSRGRPQHGKVIQHFYLDKASGGGW